MGVSPPAPCGLGLFDAEVVSPDVLIEASRVLVSDIGHFVKVFSHTQQPYSVIYESVLKRS